MRFKPHMVHAYRAEQVAEIAQFVDENVMSSTHDIPAAGVTKTSNVQILQWGKVKFFLDWSQQWLKYWNNRDIGFHIHDMQDLDLVNYNIYDSSRQGEYSWHMDAIDGPSDIKLTAVVNISTGPYEGGDLELFINERTVLAEMRTPGALVVFPSFVSHRVTPVTKGVRRSLSYWVLGPNFH